MLIIGSGSPFADTEERPVDWEAFEIDCRSNPPTRLYSWQLLPDSSFGMSGQTLLSNACSFSSDNLLQPA